MNLTDPVIPPASSDDLSHTQQVFAHAKHDFQSHISDAKDATRHATDEVQAAVASTAAAAREGYHALRQDAATHYASYREDLAGQIREQPLKSVAFAALGGVVLGLLVRR